MQISPAAVLYLRLSDKSLTAEVKSALQKHKGGSRVCLYFEDSGEKVMTDKDHGVSLSNELVTELWDILGADNVRLK